MRVKATLPAYRQLEQEIEEKKTIGDLKRSICAELGIEESLTRLILNGKTLSEKSKVTRLGHTKNPIIVDYLWARHLLAWGIEGQKRIRSATVLLAGAGAIGNEVAKNLAMLGIGRLFMVDRDIVELSNISRMIFFDRPSLGKNKAEVLARNVHRRYPIVETAAYRGNLEDMPLKIYLDSDVILSGLDNVISRFYLSQIARKYSIPLLDGGIMGLTARVQTYTSPDAACPVCIFPHTQYSNITGLRNPCDAPAEQQTVPSFSTSISLVSSILSQEVIKIVLGFNQYRETGKWPESTGEPLGSVLFMDLKNNRFTSMALKRNEACLLCGKDGTARSTARRFDLSLSALRSELERAVRSTAHLEQESVTLFWESSRGERKLTEKEKTNLRKGDYIRVIAANKTGEMTECMIRVT